jgi:hypothetical protein
VGGQVATELIIIAAFVLSILLPLLAYLTSSIVSHQEQARLSQVREVVRKLGAGADWVWLQGMPARFTLRLCVPEGVQEIGLDRHILFRVETVAGTTDISYSTIANLTGYIPAKPGCYEFAIYALEDAVNISVG